MSNPVGEPSTIAAIATASGPGGVGIVRISGPHAVPILARVLRRSEGEFIDRHLIHGWAWDILSEEKVDEVLAVAMRRPRSYTGEDVGEIHGHGGLMNMARLLRLVFDAGARAAEPGEFTRRAFQNGRLDLTRAEAVADVIGAASERALRVAQAQLQGRLGEVVERLHSRVVGLLAEVEAAIDFPSEDLDFVPLAEVAAQAASISTELQKLAGTYVTGRALREGVQIALVGAPNVGKSSLLNAFVGQERAIVTPEPGTTRDYVEARVVWEGVPVLLIDTAGERDALGEAERRGVELGRARARHADVIVRVEDATVTCGSKSGLHKSVGEGEVRIWNKIDLTPGPQGELGVSAVTGDGLNELRRMILNRVLGSSSEGDEAEIVTSERHRQLLDEAAGSVGRAALIAKEARPHELVAVDLREAANRLSAIMGVDSGEAVLEQIFSRFCIGK